MFHSNFGNSNASQSFLNFENYSAHGLLVALHQASCSVSVHISVLAANKDFVGVLCRFSGPSFFLATSSLKVCAGRASSHLRFPDSDLSLLNFVKLPCFPRHPSSYSVSGMCFQGEIQSDLRAHLICCLLSRITVLGLLLFK